MAEPLNCWRCGASLSDLSLPLARRDECAQCLAELHVCKLCVFFDPAVTRSCREDDAEEVKEKDRANFCDYFKPSANAYVPGFNAATAGARAELANLFGAPTDSDQPAPTTPDDDPTRALDDLFKS